MNLQYGQTMLSKVANGYLVDTDNSTYNAHFFSTLKEALEFISKKYSG